MLGELIIRWTIRISMSAYAVALTASILREKSLITRSAWIFAWAMFSAHVFAAFHFFHSWSQQHALDHTATQTQELLGWEFGQGIYFSYLFLLIWTIDAVWCGLAVDSYWRRAWWLSAAIHTYIFFIAFNGLVVFKTGMTRWTSLVVIGGIFAAWLWKRSRSGSATASADDTTTKKLSIHNL